VSHNSAAQAAKPVNMPDPKLYTRHPIPDTETPEPPDPKPCLFETSNPAHPSYKAALNLSASRRALKRLGLRVDLQAACSLASCKL
jgi:hypothetical protein